MTTTSLRWDPQIADGDVILTSGNWVIVRERETFSLFDDGDFAGEFPSTVDAKAEAQRQADLRGE